MSKITTDHKVCFQIAEKLLGWKQVGDNELYFFDERAPIATERRMRVVDPSYTPRGPHKRFWPLESYEDAMLVMEALGKQREVCFGPVDDWWFVAFRDEPRCYTEAPKLTEAICKFAEKVTKKK